MMYLGIDPGLDGGIAFILDSAIQLLKTPVIGGRDYDIQEMKRILQKYDIPGIVEAKIFAVIENQISMPGQGLTSTLQTGKGFGIWLGLLAGLNIPFQVVSARQWQSKLFTGVNGKLDTKDKSEVVAKRLFPTADFRKSALARVANDGLTDAACIAEYARRIHTGERDLHLHTGRPHTKAFGLEDSPICTGCGKYVTDFKVFDCSEGK